MKSNTFSSLLLLVFITLKLTHTIAWSWFWVLSPFWIPATAAVLILSAAFSYYSFFETPEQFVERKIREIVERISQ